MIGFGEGSETPKDKLGAIARAVLRYETMEDPQLDRIRKAVGYIARLEQLTGSVPIACEFALSDRWYKAAEAVFDEKGKLCLWSPKK